MHDGIPTAAFATLGCKVNQYETQRISESFEARGFRVVAMDQTADVYVVNTCSVTQSAEGKSRQMARRLARQNPDAVLVLTGCYVEMVLARGEAAPLAHLVVPNAEKQAAVEHLLRAYPALAPNAHCATARPVRAQGRTRALLKVQDGCDQFCAFCSIPFTRPVLQSRPAEELLSEAAQLAAAGYRELVVTGVLVGSYGPDTGSGGLALPGLLTRLAATPGIERVRLSSVEAIHVTSGLLEAMAASPVLCRHLHIPLQSGDTGVLRAMNRPYTRDDYLRLCDRAYRALPDLAITTDVLVGFPGETEDAFANTVRTCEEAGVARAHIFRFSARPGTAAADLPDAPAPQVLEDRAHRLASACRVVQNRYVQRFVGRTMGVLVEARERGGERYTGYTTNYIRVAFGATPEAVGTIMPVRLGRPSGPGAEDGHVVTIGGMASAGPADG